MHLVNSQWKSSFVSWWVVDLEFSFCYILCVFGFDFWLISCFYQISSWFNTFKTFLEYLVFYLRKFRVVLVWSRVVFWSTRLGFDLLDSDWYSMLWLGIILDPHIIDSILIWLVLYLNLVSGIQIWRKSNLQIFLYIIFTRACVFYFEWIVGSTIIGKWLDSTMFSSQSSWLKEISIFDHLTSWRFLGTTASTFHATVLYCLLDS